MYGQRSLLLGVSVKNHCSWSVTVKDHCSWNVTVKDHCSWNVSQRSFLLEWHIQRSVLLECHCQRSLLLECHSHRSLFLEWHIQRSLLLECHSQRSFLLECHSQRSWYISNILVWFTLVETVKDVLLLFMHLQSKTYALLCVLHQKNSIHYFCLQSKTIVPLFTDKYFCICDYYIYFLWDLKIEVCLRYKMYKCFTFEVHFCLWQL